MIRRQSRCRHGKSSNTTLIIILVVIGALVLTCVGIGIVGFALVGPALAKAREQAMSIKSASQQRFIAMALMQAEADGDEPIMSLDEMVQRNLITADLLQSPFGPVGDGQGDYWFEFDRPDMGELGRLEMPSYVVSYDRAMYINWRMVAYCTIDMACGHASSEEFEALLAHPINTGRDFNLPARTRP
jgi:hypothetical protein